MVDVGEGIVDFGKGIGDGIVDAGNTIGNVAVDGFNTVKDGINSAIDKIGDFGSSIGDAFKDLIGSKLISLAPLFLGACYRGTIEKALHFKGIFVLYGMAIY